MKLAYDALGRCIEIQSPSFHQVIPPEGFDAAGHLLNFNTQDVAYHFSYDDQEQIDSEQGHVSHTYAFDSVFNRTCKDQEECVHNALNQLLQKGEEQLIYDANGNLIQRLQGEKRSEYRYDALDRLVEVTQDELVTTYVYDAFHRLLSKKQGNEEEFFVYQGQDEIGRWKQGAFQELRLLSNHPRHPLVAIELQGKPYIPLHDLFGNVVCLLDPTGQVIERYRYTAFGESEVLNPEGEILQRSIVGNPWCYASKRLDEETGFVAFGLRYYDPGLGRWVTPDPAGFTDGPNLYAYAHTSPLLYYDQFGLFSLVGDFGLKFGS